MSASFLQGQRRPKVQLRRSQSRLEVQVKVLEAKFYSALSLPRSRARREKKKTKLISFAWDKPMKIIMSAKILSSFSLRPFFRPSCSVEGALMGFAVWMNHVVMKGELSDELFYSQQSLEEWQWTFKLWFFVVTSAKHPSKTLHWCIAIILTSRYHLFSPDIPPDGQPSYASRSIFISASIECHTWVNEAAKEFMRNGTKRTRGSLQMKFKFM